MSKKQKMFRLTQDKVREVAYFLASPHRPLDAATLERMASELAEEPLFILSKDVDLKLKVDAVRKSRTLNHKLDAICDLSLTYNDLQLRRPIKCPPEFVPGCDEHDKWFKQHGKAWRLDSVLTAAWRLLGQLGQWETAMSNRTHEIDPAGIRQEEGRQLQEALRRFVEARDAVADERDVRKVSAGGKTTAEKRKAAAALGEAQRVNRRHDEIFVAYQKRIRAGMDKRKIAGVLAKNFQLSASQIHRIVAKRKTRIPA